MVEKGPVFAGVSDINCYSYGLGNWEFILYLIRFTDINRYTVSGKRLLKLSLINRNLF